MKRLAAAIIPLVITGGLILPSAWAGTPRCNADTLKAYNSASKLELPAKEGWTTAQEKTLTDLAKAVGCSPSVLRYIVFHGVGAPVFNEYLRNIQNDEVEKAGKSFDGLDAAKAKVDAQVDELNKAIERFKKSSTDNVSATEKIELLGKILACKPGQDAADKKPRCEMNKDTELLTTDLGKTQDVKKALKGGTLFAELDLAYWMLGDHALLTGLLKKEPGWQEDGAGLFVPGSMKALKNVLMGADASKVPAAVDSAMGLDLHAQWEDSRDALNDFFKQFGDSAKLEAAYGLIEQAKAKEVEADQAAAGRRGKIEAAKLPSTLSGQLDTELLSRVFDNKKAAGELSEYANFEEWKSKKGPEAEAELKKIKMAAGLIDAEGKPISGAGFQVGSDGREILFTPKGAKTPDKIAVGFAGENVDMKKDYSKDIAGIADKILQRSPGAAKLAALRTAVDQAKQNPEQLAKDAAMRGGVFGPLNIAPEAYSREELASKRQAAMDGIAGQHSALRQGARARYDGLVADANAKFAVEEKKCLAANWEQAAYNACIKPHLETRDQAVAAARGKLKTEISQIGTEEDFKGKLLQSEARQIAATDFLWSQELGKSVIKAKGAVTQKMSSDPYLKEADVNEFWDSRWNSEKSPAEYAKRVADLQETLKKQSLNSVEGTVKGTVLKEFNGWWAPKRAERVKSQQGIQRPTTNIGNDDFMTGIDAEVERERQKK